MEANGAVRRSTRQRQNVARADDAFQPTAAMSETATVKATPQSTPKKPPSRSVKKDPWSLEQLTTSKKSKLIFADLKKLFSDPAAWAVLEDEEKAEILSLLPAHVAAAPKVSRGDNEGPAASPILPVPSEQFLRYDTDWQDALRRYQEDLSSGRYDPEWQRQAAVAMEERAQGKFDNFKEEQFEDFWGQKTEFNKNGNNKALGYGTSASVKIEKLIKHGVFQVGDLWKFRRVFEEENIVVEKDARISEVPKSRSMTFVVPGGQRASFDIFGESVITNADDTIDRTEAMLPDRPGDTDPEPDKMDDEVVVHNVTGPNVLARKILAIDGRLKKGSPSNVWTSFRAFRNGHDLGTLAEIRQAWFDDQMS